MDIDYSKFIKISFIQVSRFNLTKLMISLADYQVASYDGTKSIILTNSKVVGSKNYFLAIVYMAVGGICLFLSLLFFLLRIRLQNL